MNKEEMLKTLESELNVVNKGVFNPEYFDDASIDSIKEIYDMVVMRGNLSPQEQTALIDELSKLRK